MTLLVTGLAVFLGIHLLPTFTAARDGIAARLGENGYKMLFSALSLAGLVLLVMGFARAPFVELWSPPHWLRHVTILLMLPALVFLAAFQTGGRMARKLKHPFLSAVKTWSFAHLLANGDLASLLLFGPFLAYASYDRFSVKWRGLPRPAPEIPFGKRDYLALVLGLVYFVAIVFWLHEWVIGVPVLI